MEHLHVSIATRVHRKLKATNPYKSLSEWTEELLDYALDAKDKIESPSWYSHPQLAGMIA